MEPKQNQGFAKIRPFLSIATFIGLLIGVGLLTLNLMFALIDKFS
ncbi:MULTISPECIES: hypothetical protein [Oscillatoriales]|jgi:hypothetical protein|uniref:Uncharacterized protein n=2 Tax=Limnospira TaxID=2596745 RepID=A0A9P1KIW0_9CYAN|nr:MULTISPECIES: hypothetical protein [Limnospira]MDT9185155.1 hypothetical protein [Limnospira sp. PMC 289.06]MDT9297341.1 hypothetical protein [Arthrospira platensis PCC 7345]MDT9312804.1 hypothetical protein [Limnospira sp. Paracas R14]CDM96846.1 conserved protein of unknown function [Limnospira indica PCC 8005]BDT14861.1 hypothetical protein N39L_45840 [Arthrospira platensis NIES-39]GCE95951.1 hypothetical protein NIES46_40170 [Arthrospira platensis NIES-46]